MKIVRPSHWSLLAGGIAVLRLCQASAAPVDLHLSRANPPTVVQIESSAAPESVGPNPGDWSSGQREDIVGATDDRRPAGQPALFPNRALVIVETTGLATCTGWLIAADVVVTAGHCVNTGKGFWAPLTGAYPMRIWHQASPLGGTMKWCSATRLYSTQGWVEHGDERYDYGAIKLTCDIGKQLGWWGFGWTDHSVVGQALALTGYVVSDPATGCHAVGQRRLQCVGAGMAKQELEGQLYYDIDTSVGDSGSPVVAPAVCAACVLAIHTTPFEPDKPEPHQRLNHGTIISRQVFANLKAWARAQ